MPRQSPSADDVPRVDGMPVLGLGTWDYADPDQCTRTVRRALELGYRHVDTAQLYRNEAAVGEGIAAADVPREEVFLATKVYHDSLAYDDVVRTTRESLDRLGVDAVDLLYIHWPAGTYDPDETLSAFADLAADGLTERVGVSNFEPDQLDVAIDACDVPIFANQFEAHPLLPQFDLLAHCRERGVEPVAYSPLARQAVLDVPELRTIADTHGVTPAQVSLAWLRETGYTAIPKATGEAHLRENLSSLDLELAADELETIDSIDRRERTVDPGWAPW